MTALVPEYGSDLRSFRVQQGCLCGDLNGLGYVSDLKLRVNRDHLCDAQLNTFPIQRFEALRLKRDPVRSDRKVRIGTGQLNW